MESLNIQYSTVQESDCTPCCHMEQDNITINVYQSIIICVPKFFNSFIILVVDIHFANKIMKATNIDKNTVYVFFLAFHPKYMSQSCPV